MNTRTVLSLCLLLTGGELTVATGITSVDAAAEKGPKNQEENVGAAECRGTALHHAFALVRVLVEKGADHSMPDCQGITPQDIAMKENLEFLVRYFNSTQDKSAERSKVIGRNCRSSPLHHLVRSVAALVEQGSEDLTVPDCQGLLPEDLFVLPGEVFLAVPKSDQKQEVEPVCNRTNLHSAVISRDLFLVRQLLENDADMFSLDCQGMTPMDLALLQGDRDLILAFVKNNFDVNRKRADGHSLLHFAITKGNEKSVRLLFYLGARVDFIKTHGSALLLDAILSNKTNIAHFLADQGAQINNKSADGNTCLHRFSEEENIQALVMLKSSNFLSPYLVKSRNNKNETALSLAVKKNYPAVINILLSSGAEVGEEVENRSTYLQIAIKYNSCDALRTLLENGMPVDMKNGVGETPILFAVRNDFVKCMDILKEFGSDLKQLNCIKNNTLIHNAAINGSLSALLWLLENGFSTEDKNINKFTPLHYAARYGQLAIVKALITRGANVNAETDYKDTPLHWASVQGNLEIVLAIIANGGKVDEKQINGYTPLILAAKHGHLPIVKALVSRGADVDAVNELNHAALYYAKLYKRNDIVQYLESMKAL